MKFLVKLVLPFVRKYILEEIAKEDNKTFVVNKINEHVDLPNLNENEERELIENIYKSLTVLIKAQLKVED